MANKHMKRCSKSLIIREMQMQMTMKSHLAPVRIAIIKNLNAGEDVEKSEPSCTVGGNINWYSHYGEQFCSAIQSCLTLCDPMDFRTPGFPVLHSFPELAQTYTHWVDDAIQLSHPLSSPSTTAFNLSQHQHLF